MITQLNGCLAKTFPSFGSIGSLVIKFINNGVHNTEVWSSGNKKSPGQKQTKQFTEEQKSKFMKHINSDRGTAASREKEW